MLNQIWKQLIFKSLLLKKGDSFYLEAIDCPEAELDDLIKYSLQNKVYPYVSIKSSRIFDLQALNGDSSYYEKLAEIDISILKQSSGFLGLRGLNGTDSDKILPPVVLDKVLDHYIKPVHFQYRNNHLNWTYFRVPIQENFSNSFNKKNYYASASINYHKFLEIAYPLLSLLKETNELRFQHQNGSDLTMSLSRSVKKYASFGEHNIPDGEIFTAPDVESVSGNLYSNVPSRYYNSVFVDINLVFRNGKVVKAKCSDNYADERLNALLTLDSGASKLGEVAFGLNPFIETPVCDILIDEKMWGTSHFALGNAYPMADNGNRSKIHWDLILDFKKDGGGSIYFDGEEIQRNGIFIKDELDILNPKKLKKEIENG